MGLFWVAQRSETYRHSCGSTWLYWSQHRELWCEILSLERFEGDSRSAASLRNLEAHATSNKPRTLEDAAHSISSLSDRLNAAENSRSCIRSAKYRDAGDEKVPKFEVVSCYGESSAGAVRVATHPDVDFVVSAIVGVAGLEATYEAVKAGKTVGLANKECLVAAGELITAEARRQGKPLAADRQRTQCRPPVPAGRANGGSASASG